MVNVSWAKADDCQFAGPGTFFIRALTRPARLNPPVAPPDDDQCEVIIPANGTGEIIGDPFLRCSQVLDIGRFTLRAECLERINELRQHSGDLEQANGGKLSNHLTQPGRMIDSRHDNQRLILLRQRPTEASGRSVHGTNAGNDLNRNLGGNLGQ